jgi:hypothetical protein
MSLFASEVVHNIVLVTAIINLVLVIALFFTCRLFPSSLLKWTWYKFLYRYHSYIWWVLMPSVIIHAVLAILHTLSGG